MTRWFEVDRAGLRKLLEQRGVAFVLYELISNAWDAPGTTHVEVSLEPIPGAPRAKLHVVDDAPGGFTRLEHAWTLFAESERKGDTSKRGRWNLGEKLVLSMCESAEILTTTGGVRFDIDGRHTLRRKTAQGSEFNAVLRVTRDQIVEIELAAKLLLPPAQVVVSFNTATLVAPPWVKDFETDLPTEVANEEGVLVRTRRKAKVNVYHPNPQGAWLYEMGVPVAETELPWSVDVQQKIPLTLDRTNVATGFLRELRVALLAEMARQIPQEHLTAPWLREACASPRAEPLAVKEVLERRFGKDAVAYDPSDPEGSKIAVSEGLPVIHGATLSSGEWDNARRAGVLLPAGQVTPSPRVLCSPDGDPPVPEEDWTPAMKRRAQAIKVIGWELLGGAIFVRFHNKVTLPPAWYGGRTVTFNIGRLGRAWLEKPLCSDEVLGLVIHELAHEVESDHLSREYHEACCELGAKAVRAALVTPERFKEDQS